MIATCRDCGTVIDGGSSPVIAMGPEETANKLDVEWWTLAEYVLSHMVQFHPDKAQFLTAGANSVIRVESMRLVDSSDGTVAALLGNHLSTLCERFAPGVV